ncbi:hypothetical protein [Pararhizobium arenae]|uniref:hypothetical protein n=1 Tax=Pararhizobium arenae TaxID=1856850 RepID=UPI000A6B4A52|nr:hypothetical protein [Pararhizobium arenae]
MPHFHRLHVDAHAGRPIRPMRRREPQRPARPVEMSAEAEIATFLRAFAVVALAMAGAAAVIILG